MANMELVLPFLTRLGLRADADPDAGAIRRAYARELKLIDQESQLAQFQQLREAYEQALQWASVSTVPAPVPGQTAEDDCAAPVFARFLQACLPMRQKERVRDLAGWEDVLRRHVADPSLVNLSASLAFEKKVAAYLAAGWEPGNDTLFQAAAQVFEWARDARRVAQLGDAAGTIAQTLHELYQFDCQEEGAYKMSRNVLVGLRLGVPPLNMRLRLEMAHLESMLQYFPTLIAVTAGLANVARWRAQYADLVPPAPPVSVHAIAFVEHRAASQGRAVMAELSVPLTIVVIVFALARLYFAFSPS